MLTFRCTVLLQKKLHIYPAADGPASTTILGDWYAHLLISDRLRLIVCVSEVTRLPVIIAARDLGTVVPRFQAGLREVLKELGIPTRAIENELGEMTDVVFAKTKSRRVLGTINDFFVHLRWAIKDRPDFSPFDYALYLSGIAVGPYPNYIYPAEETRKLLGGRLVVPFPNRRTV